MRLMLDTSVLGRVCHPRKDLVARGRMLAAVRGEEHVVIISALAEYELRRELLLTHSTTSLAHLDDLCRVAMYAPVTVEARSAGGHPIAKPGAGVGEVDLRHHERVGRLRRADPGRRDV